LRVDRARVDLDIVDFDPERRRLRRGSLRRDGGERQDRAGDEHDKHLKRPPHTASASDYTGALVYNLNNYTKAFVVL
jgi:hypothetical protein